MMPEHHQSKPLALWRVAQTAHHPPKETKYIFSKLDHLTSLIAKELLFKLSSILDDFPDLKKKKKSTLMLLINSLKEYLKSTIVEPRRIRYCIQYIGDWDLDLKFCSIIS